MNKFNNKTTKRAYRLFSIFAAIVLVFSFSVTAFAADDPLTVVNNLSDFIFSLIRAVGIILLGFGILQIGLSLKSHDPSQRANGMLTVAGGLSLLSAKRSSLLSPVNLLLTVRERKNLSLVIFPQEVNRNGNWELDRRQLELSP